MTVLRFLLISLLPATFATGQTSHGYGFLGVGGLSGLGRTQSLLHAGGGGEARIIPGLGIGGEGGYLGPTERLGSGVGVASVNGYFHPITGRRDKFDPFFTAGYSLIFRRDAVNAFNYGGGFNYWLDSGLGLKLEIRDHVRSPSNFTLHYWAVRFGVNFR